jgi:hypothetical protein
MMKTVPVFMILGELDFFGTVFWVNLTFLEQYATDVLADAKTNLSPPNRLLHPNPRPTAHNHVALGQWPRFHAGTYCLYDAGHRSVPPHKLGSCRANLSWSS